MSRLDQLRDEAITMLVLWAAKQDYSAEIEAQLKVWANVFQIPEQELTNRIMAAAEGRLMLPGQPQRGGLPPPGTTAAAAAALAAAAPPAHYMPSQGFGGQHQFQPQPQGYGYQQPYRPY